MSKNPYIADEPAPGMTLREKTLWASALLTAALYAYYFWRVVDIGDSDPARVGGLFLGVVIALIVLHVVVAAVLAIHHRRPEPVDERDHQIALVATRYAYYVLMIGVWGALAVCVLPLGRFWVAHAALLAIVLGELTRCGVQLYHHRRGA